MKVSEALKAKYVFDELTLGEVLDLVWKKVEVFVVHQDGTAWDHIYFDRSGDKLSLYDGSDKYDDGEALWEFSLKEKVRVKGNMIYFKKERKDGPAIELLRTSKIDVTKMLQKG
jgi:hypothetical protein